MGIQDRDYWRECDKGQATQSTGHSSAQPPGKVYSSWGPEIEKPKPKMQGILVHRWAWVVPMFFGFILGKNWERLQILGRLFYDKFISAIF